MKKKLILKTLFLFLFLLNACTSTTPTSTPDLIVEEPSLSLSLPEIYQSSQINSNDIPHTYIEDTCRYLRNKWNPANASPGTIVMIILIKNINRGTADIPNSINLVEFGDLMQQLRLQGFKAINTEQLQAFMERNIEIPSRSVYIIQDGNQMGIYYDKIFRDYFENWGWAIVNGWISQPETPESLLRENLELEAEGFVDHQARGISPDTILSDESGKTVIARELQGSLSGFANQFGKTPTAIIWPNGGFGYRPVEAARQLRFKLGFTTNPRGPIMYNWVPLAASIDPQRPELQPESQIDDPLMTLPTYSPNEALLAIDVVRAIGKAAAEYADSNKDTEYRYYENVCEEEYGPMPTP